MFAITCYFCDRLNRIKLKNKDAAGPPEESCEKLRFLVEDLRI